MSGPNEMGDGRLYDEPSLVEYIAARLGFNHLSRVLPGSDIYPPYLFVGIFLILDHGVIQLFIHLNGGTHILIDFPNVIIGPIAVLFGVFGIRYMSNGYSDALAATRVQRRVDESDINRFRRMVAWRTKIAIFLLAVVILYAHIILNVGLSTVIREGGGGISLFNWLFAFEFVYLPVIVEFALTYYYIHFRLPRHLQDTDIDLFFYDPRNMGGFAAVGTLLKWSYYLYTAGLLMFFIVVYGGVILQLI